MAQVVVRAGAPGKPLNLANGVLANIFPCRIRDIKDGTSSTLLVGEITGGGQNTHQGDFWVTWDLCDTSNGINSGLTVPGGGVFGVGTYASSRSAGFSSYHLDGCHFLFCDGSVTFLSQNIDSILLAALTTRAGQELGASATGGSGGSGGSGGGGGGGGSGPPTE